MNLPFPRACVRRLRKSFRKLTGFRADGNLTSNRKIKMREIVIVGYHTRTPTAATTTTNAAAATACIRSSQQQALVERLEACVGEL